MKHRFNWVVLSLIVISILALILTAIPNAKASENIAMVSMFEPDEGIIVPVIQNMISPKDTWKQWVYNFIAYRYYFYGFPFFAPSALVLLTLKWLKHDSNLPLVMLSLRQVISVLPMLASIWIQTYMHDRFKTYRSLILFLFLILVPAMIKNAFWWHPDGLVLLLSTLVLFFLWRDERRFGWRFFFTAVLTGVLTALKLVGVYFFLAIALVLIWGWMEKKLSIKKLLLKSLLFLLIMVVSLYVSNPFLLLSIQSTRTYLELIQRQSADLAAGYGITYEKGLAGAWPLMHQYYGEAIFLITTLAVTIWGIVKKETRFLHALTLAWFLPLTFSLLFFSHFKYQYWLPVAIPLFSNLIILLPRSKSEWLTSRAFQLARIVLMALVAVQMVLFGVQSTRLMIERTQRQENNPEIAFYDLAMQQLEPISSDPVYAYHDYRLYMPEHENWVVETSFELLDNDFIQKVRYDLLFLQQQRIWDYLQPNAVGVDPQVFAKNQAFYRDADAGKIQGYYLLFRNETALLFIKDSFCLKYFPASRCQ